MKRRNLITMVALAAALLVGTGTANAQCYVGCLSHGGTVKHMTLGPAPLKDCGPNETQIKICGATHRDPQNEEAKVGFTEFCRAFEDAGLPLPSGCPDVGGIHTPTDWNVAGPGGGMAPVRYVGGTDPADPFNIQLGTTYDSISERFNMCGLLKTEAATPPHGFIVLPKSYFHTAKEFIEAGPGTEPFDRALEACRQECEADRYCVAADLLTVGIVESGKTEIKKFRCSMYHHNADLPEGADYKEECDGATSLLPPFTESDTKDFCAKKTIGLILNGPWWLVRQPDGCVGNPIPPGF